MYGIKLILKNREQQQIQVKIPSDYQQFLRDMEKNHQLENTTNYIYIDDQNHITLLINSEHSYKQMLNRLKSQPTQPILQVKEEQENFVGSKKKSEDEEKHVTLIKKDGEQEKLVLAENFTSFLRKMKNKYDYIKETQYSYVDNINPQELIISSSSSYDLMLMRQRNNPRQSVLRVIDKEFDPQVLKKMQVIDEEEQIKNDTRYNELFFGGSKEISCVCQFLQQDARKCNYCKGSEQIDFHQQGLYNELNQEFRSVIKKNFQKIKKYIKDNYKEEIENFTSWLVFHPKLMNFEEDQREFYFRCKNCCNFYSKAKVVYVKSKVQPQNPLCHNCYIQKKSSEVYLKLGDFFDDELFLQPPNLLKQ